MSATDGDRSRKRPWLAALLAVLYPGLGHLYLREWLRAIMWFALVVSSAVLLLPTSAVPETVSLEAYLEAIRAIPFEVSLAILAVSVLSVLDAYWLARRANDAAASPDPTPAAGDTRTCPHCGKEVDADLDFCHWCTSRLDSPEGDHEA